MVFWTDTKFIVESVVPYFFHIIPTCDNTVFNWVFQLKNTSFGLSFIPDVSVLLDGTNHRLLSSWTTYNTGKDCSWGIITGETGSQK